MAPHSSTLAWKIPWTEEPCRLQSMVARNRTRLSDFTFPFHFHALEREMATHSTVLAWTIPGMGEPGGLWSMGLHRVRHDWSDLPAEAACSCERISFNDALSRLLLTSNGWPLHSSSSRFSSPLQNFLNCHCIVCSLAVPGPNALLMLQVVSTAL